MAEEPVVIGDPAPRTRKWPIVVGVVVVVLIAAGAGFWVWHEQPSFCAAICHTPMDEYLETYEQEPGTTGVDKWGNEVSKAHGFCFRARCNSSLAVIRPSAKRRASRESATLRTPPDRERGCRLIPVRFRNQRYSPDGRGRDPRRPRPARIDADPKKPVWKEFIRARFLFRPENLTRTSRPAKRKGLP